MDIRIWLVQSTILEHSFSRPVYTLDSCLLVCLLSCQVKKCFIHTWLVYFLFSKYDISSYKRCHHFLNGLSKVAHWRPFLPHNHQISLPKLFPTFLSYFPCVHLYILFFPFFLFFPYSLSFLSFFFFTLLFSFSLYSFESNTR